MAKLFVKSKTQRAPLSALSRRSHQFMRRYQRERQIKGKIIAQLINTHDAASVARREASLELWTLIIESDIHCTSSTVHNESQHSIRLHLCGPPAKSQKTILIIYFLAFFRCIIEAYIKVFCWWEKIISIDWSLGEWKVFCHRRRKLFLCHCCSLALDGSSSGFGGEKKKKTFPIHPDWVGRKFLR